VSQVGRYTQRAFESGRELPQSKTVRVFWRIERRANVLECAQPSYALIEKLTRKNSEITRQTAGHYMGGKNEPLGSLPLLTGNSEQRNQEHTVKALYSICVAFLLPALSPAVASGQPSSMNINPALLYYQAFLVAPSPLPQTEWDYLSSYAGRSQPLPARYADIIAGYDNEFRLVRQAAHAAVPCDWGTDLSAGPATLLPQLAPSKEVMVAARLRLQWNLQHGRQAEACDDLLAAFTLARNLPRNGLLISVLVQGAMESIGCFMVADNFNHFSPEALQQLAAGLEALPPRGTVVGCIPAEKALSQDWMLRRIDELQRANPGDDAKVMAGIREMFAPVFDVLVQRWLKEKSEEAGWWERLVQAAGGTSEGVVKLVRELEPFDQKLADVLALPYSEYQSPMKQLKAEAEQSSNPLLGLGLTFWDNSRDKEFKAQVNLALVRAALEYKLHGQAAFQGVTDPCGQGPFGFRRFVFQGVDRGFELKSACPLNPWPYIMIFVEKEGPLFYTDGRYAGQARPCTSEK
jgi:hypothetical protein